MYLPFPERIPLAYVCIFSLILCAVQLIEGTAPLFSILCFLFINIAGVAFNLAGGLTRPSGAYIFFFSLLAVIVGLVGKAFFGEAADSNLHVPIQTAKAYVGGISGMLAAVFVSKRVVPKRALLANFVTDETMSSATVGFMFIGLFVTFLLLVVPREDGSILSALGQLNHFLEVALLVGVFDTIRRSGGIRLVNLPVLISGCALFSVGLLGFTKEGMFTPLVCLILAAAARRYRFSPAQIAVLIVVSFISIYYLVPYSQYGRMFRKPNLLDNIDDSVSLLTDLDRVRSEFKKSEIELEQNGILNYYNQHHGFLDRTQMIGPDDNLVNLTEQGVEPGILPVYIYFANLVPHFIWQNKPVWRGGNLYAHQMGYLADDDITTGISFSPVGESYHIMRWAGVLIIAPILYFMLFTVFDSLCGDVRNSPWGLLVLLIFSQIAPEGGLSLLVYTLGYRAALIIFMAFSTRYLMPLFGDIFVRSPRRTVIGSNPVGLAARR